MRRFTNLFCLIVISSIMTISDSIGLSVEEIKEVKEIVRDLCQYPDRQGHYMQVEGSLEGGTVLRLVGIKGKVSLSREEWDGVRDVLPADRAPDRMDVRRCAEYLTPLLLEKLEEPESGTKYRPGQYYNTVGKYKLTPRDWVQLPYLSVSQSNREQPMLGTSEWPPVGYCRFSFERNDFRFSCCSKGGCGGGAHSITKHGTLFVEEIGTIIYFKMTEPDTMTFLVDIFQYQPKQESNPDIIRPGDTIGSFKVGSIEAGWSSNDPPDKLRVNIGEGQSSSYLAEGERFNGKKADVAVTKIGKDGFGHFARVKVYYR